MNKFKIRVYPDGIEQNVEEGTTIMKALEELGIELETLCGGAGWCGQCKVKVSGKVTTPTSSEIRLLGEERIRDGFRLACQARILGNVEVEVPEETRIYVHHILTSGVTMEKTELNPAVRRFNVKLPNPSLEDQRPDLERIEDSVGLGITSVKRKVLKVLPKVLRESDFNIEAIIYDGELIEVRKVKNRHLLGIAVDIGTTTVVVYLVDLEGGNVLDVASTMNPQAKRGADVISRIDYASKGGLEDLSNLIKEEINSLIYGLCSKNGIEKEDIYDMTIVGNTTMMHLFLGVNPDYIAVSPYIPVFSRALLIDAKEL
ncbi:MAG: 2Fe-2S iron-sulfur cluster-binding protein, partial [bacterium]